MSDRAVIAYIQTVKNIYTRSKFQSEQTYRILQGESDKWNRKKTSTKKSPTGKLKYGRDTNTTTIK